MEYINPPDDWLIGKLGDVCTIIAGQSPPSEAYNMEGDGLPFFQGKTDFGEVYPKYRVYCSEPKKVAEHNDILLSVRAPVGPTNLSPDHVCIGRGLTAIRPNKSLHYKYLYYYFKAIEPQMLTSGTGSTFKAITQNDVKNIQIPIPELYVQEKIVLQIEELLSELDKGITELNIVHEQLKIHMQLYISKVFKVADSTNQKTTLSNCVDAIFDGPFGSHLKTSDYVVNGVRVVRLENIKHLWFDDSKESFVSEEKYNTIEKHTALPTDILMSTFISDNVKVCQMPNYWKYAVNKADCIVIRPSKAYNARFLMYCLASQQVKNSLVGQVHGATRPRVNTKQIKNILVPILDIDEQIKIVDQIEAQLSISEQIGQTVNESLQKAQTLRQSILKQAYEGKLI